MEGAVREEIFFLRKVLEEFNAGKVQYCLLRNYEFILDEKLKPVSLDTIISKEDLPLVEKILAKFGFTRRTQQFSHSHRAYFTLIDYKKISFDLQIGGIHWNDLCYLDETVLPRRRRLDCFYVLSPPDQLLMLIIHSILGKRYFKEKYQQIILSLLQSQEVDHRLIQQKLAQTFSESCAQSILKNLNRGRFTAISPYPLVARFILHNFSKVPSLAGLSWRWARQYHNPFRIAPLISIIGPDGAGKSTLAATVSRTLSGSGRSVIALYTGRGRGHFLPITRLGRAYKGREKRKASPQNSLASQQNSSAADDKSPATRQKLIYTFGSLVFTADLLLRYYLLIFSQRLLKRIVVTDRYCTDIILMKNVPFKLRKLLYSLFPKPTIAIYLQGKAEILHQRRPEEPVRELERQMSIFRQLPHSLHSLSLSTTERPAEATATALNYILIRLMKEWW